VRLLEHVVDAVRVAEHAEGDPPQHRLVPVEQVLEAAAGRDRETGGPEPVRVVLAARELESGVHAQGTPRPAESFSRPSSSSTRSPGSAKPTDA
jgi:hypothetical protein